MLIKLRPLAPLVFLRHEAWGVHQIRVGPADPDQNGSRHTFPVPADLGLRVSPSFIPSRGEDEAGHLG